MDFRTADLRDSSPFQAWFEDCDFSRANLAKLQFQQCFLSRCRFAGEVVEVLFDGRELSKSPAPPPMQDVDFSEATFADVEFRGFDLEDVTLPADPNVFLVRRYRCVAKRGFAELEGDESAPARSLKARLANRLRGPGTTTEAHVFNRQDYLASGGEEVANRAEELFRRLEAACLEAARPPPSQLRRLLGGKRG